MLFLSEEQTAIVDAVERGENVVVNAVAGSGKTTTVIGIGRRMPERTILQVTYNTQLRKEVAERLRREKIDNVEVHTFHSLCNRYYDRSTFTDTAIRRALKQPMISLMYSIVIIDEAQDMKELYYRFMRAVIDDSSQIVILGDHHQAIYTALGARVDYMLNPEEHWDRKFTHLGLTHSYRLGIQTAHFINRIMLGQDRIIGRRSASRPVKLLRYELGGIFRDPRPLIMEQINDIVRLIERALETGGPDSVFILAPSIRVGSWHPLKLIENELCRRGVMCYYAWSDDGALTDETIRRKVVFCSFHQSKGRERDFVFVYGFDSGYFEYYARDSPPNECTSALYVATTRAKSQLILIETMDSLPFLRIDSMEKWFVNVTTNTGRKFCAFDLIVNPRPIKPRAVTDIIRFMPESITAEVEELVEVYGIDCTIARYNDRPSFIVDFETHSEDVSTIIGMALPLAIQDIILGRDPKTADEYIDSVIDIYSRKDGILWPTTQIIRRDFYPQMYDVAMRVVDNIGQIVPLLDVKFEIGGIREKAEGICDMMTDDTIWEFKVGALSMEHWMQLIMYKWIFGDKYTYYLCSLIDGDIYRLDADAETIDQICQKMMARLQ